MSARLMNIRQRKRVTNGAGLHPPAEPEAVLDDDDVTDAEDDDDVALVYAQLGERLEVLRDVTFSANAGETIAITGASGSGKSTLLHLLGGLETADHGSVTLNGTGGRRQEIGFVFQFHYLLSDLSAVENIALPLLIARHNSRQAHERALALLKDAGLGTRADHPVSHLSGGEQQRVAVARAAAFEEELLSTHASALHEVEDALAKVRRRRGPWWHRRRSQPVPRSEHKKPLSTS